MISTSRVTSRAATSGKQRCATCLLAADVAERDAVEQRQKDMLLEARGEAKRAESGVGANRLAAAAKEAAVEATMVTGLKPVRIGGGRGRGRGRGSNTNSMIGRGGRGRG